MVWWKGDTIWKTIYGNFVRKVFELYGVYTLTMDVFKPVMIAIGFFYWTFWATLALSSMAIALRFVFGAFLMPSYCFSRFCCGFVSTSKSERILECRAGLVLKYPLKLTPKKRLWNCIFAAEKLTKSLKDLLQTLHPPVVF